MASLAQQESESLSQNVKLGLQYRYQQGKVLVNHTRFLGYDKDEDGNLIINKEEAEVVKRIFREYLEGYSFNIISKGLQADGIKTAAGSDRWLASTLHKILRNEKYMGDALLQKTVTTDFLTKKRVVNKGLVPQYYVEGCHEAIIPPATFDYVQEVMANRQNGDMRYCGVSIFSSKIKCGLCGGWFGAKVWHSTDKYRKVVHQCNNKYRKGNRCNSTHVTEAQVKDAFVRAFNRMIRGKKEMVANVQLIIDTLCNGELLEKKRMQLREELVETKAQMERSVEENAHHALDQDECEKQYNALLERYEKLKTALENASKSIETNGRRKVQLEQFVCTLKAHGQIKEFEDQLWTSLVSYVTVYSAKDIRVTFKDGTEI